MIGVSGNRPRAALLLAGALALALCAACTPLEDEKPVRRPLPRPAMLFDDTVTMDFHDGPALVWRLRTGYLERWGNDERLFVRPVDVEFFDSLGYRAATLRADSGTIDGNFSSIRAYGNVHAQSFDGASVRSDSLLYDKNRDKVMRFKQWGLLLFVAIPLPGTGGWTGSLIAAMLDIDFKKSLPIIAIGVLIADVIMSVLVYGTGAVFGF